MLTHCVLNMSACSQLFVCPVRMAMIPHSRMSLISALCQDNQTSPLWCPINQVDKESGGGQLCKASMCAHNFGSRKGLPQVLRNSPCLYVFMHLSLHAHEHTAANKHHAHSRDPVVKSIAAITTNK